MDAFATNRNITRRLWALEGPFSRFSLVLGVTAALITLDAGAEWKFEGAPLRKSVQNSRKPGKEAEAATSPQKTPTRIQVFGSGKVVPVEEARRGSETASDAGPAAAVPSEPVLLTEADVPRDEKNDTSAAYAEMLKADEERLKRLQNDREADQAFESMRARMRTRKVAETTEEAPSEPAPAAAPPRVRQTVPTPAKTPPKRTVSPRPAPVPEMETETITPQKAVKSAPAFKEDPRRASGEVNPAFPYTHLLPSPFNLPQGTWVVGSSIGYGLLDFLQVSTNTVRTLQGHWNFQAKVPLVEYPTFVASAFVSYESYNPNNIAADNPDMRLNRWQPGLVTGYELSSDMAVFLGGNFNFGEDPIPVKTTSGYLHGAQIEADWSWLYNPSNSRLGDNAISAGVTYDLTYSLLGFGLTHHWRTFQLGVHYTLADRDRFLPIAGFSFGATF